MRTAPLFASLLMTLTASAAYAQDAPMMMHKEFPAAAPAAMENQAAPLPQSGEMIDSVGSDAIPALPLEMLTENGVSYISGGIGDEEKEQLEAQEGNFNIHVLITGMNGEFVSSVKFRLTSAKNTPIITIEDAGPYVYIKIPAGNYTAEVISNGASQKTALKVPAKGAVKTQIHVAG